MTYVIAEPGVDVMDRACLEECPVDRIDVGGRSLYIDPGECVDRGARELVCPVEAVFYGDDLPQRWTIDAEDNAEFCTDILAGRQAPLGDPGGAAKMGDLPVDTDLVASLPPAAGTGAS